MTTAEFNQWVNSLPVRTKVIGKMADGSPLTVEVHSMFGDADED